MEFHNLTPFPALAFEGIDQHDQEFHVIVMRATFDILPSTELKLAEEQQPLAVVDEYFGEMNKSSVRQESDLAQYKPKCDVIVIGAAHAPGGNPAPSFQASVRITNPQTASAESPILEKLLNITGPRYWRITEKDWQLTEPEPIVSLPICYEYSYGGECRIDKDDPAAQRLDPARFLTTEQRAQHPDGPDHAPAAHTACETNPIGMGYVEPWYLEATRPESPIQRSSMPQLLTPKGGFLNRMASFLGVPSKPVAPSGEAPSSPPEPYRIPAPQIESPQDPISEFGKHYTPQGLGVITKAWLPRRKLGGTADEEFAQSECWLPEDFDFAFWNGAHPDMQAPWLKGGERIEMKNLFPPGIAGAATDKDGNSIVSFIVPEQKPYLFVFFADKGIVPYDLKIDTVMIDTDNSKLALTYRTTLWKEPEISALAAKVISKRDQAVIDGWLNQQVASSGEEVRHG